VVAVGGAGPVAGQGVGVGAAEIQRRVRRVTMASPGVAEGWDEVGDQVDRQD
jgi:hypothetical protein